VNYQSFDQLLHVDVRCVQAIAGHAALLVVGDCAGDMARQLAEAGCVVHAEHEVRLWFGLPILTAPFPLFVGALVTERNTVLQQMSLFAWIEDNAIEQPRAEVFGLTPFGEQPVLFLRDLDLDQPVEVWLQTPQPTNWVRVVGVVIATAQHGGERRVLALDQAALSLMQHTLPADAQPFVADLAVEVAQGSTLKAALRRRRKTTSEALMNICEAWRVLARAASVVQLNPCAGRGEQQVGELLKLAPPKKW
jgi:hypothetical protein